jgi:hypothetical protein
MSLGDRFYGGRKATMLAAGRQEIDALSRQGHPRLEYRVGSLATRAIIWFQKVGPV